MRQELIADTLGVRRDGVTDAKMRSNTAGPYALSEHAPIALVCAASYTDEQHASLSEDYLAVALTEEPRPLWY